MVDHGARSTVDLATLARCGARDSRDQELYGAACIDCRCWHCWLPVNAARFRWTRLSAIWPRSPIVPESIAAQLPAWERTIGALAPPYSDARTFLYLGRGVHYAIAREGALKLKESSYLTRRAIPAASSSRPECAGLARGPAGRARHGRCRRSRIVLRYEKTVSLLYDMREQGARVLALANAGDATIPGARLQLHSY